MTHKCDSGDRAGVACAYFVMWAVTAVITGAVTWIVLALCDVDRAWLWALLVFFSGGSLMFSVLWKLAERGWRRDGLCELCVEPRDSEPNPTPAAGGGR